MGRWHADCTGRALTSWYHQQSMAHLDDRSVFARSTNVNIISWAIKVRWELIDLNHKHWLRDAVFTCSLGNSSRAKTVFHFVTVCPILSHIRQFVLGKASLEKSNYEGYLNGRDWWALVGYVRDSWYYRLQLIAEFNF